MKTYKVYVNISTPYFLGNGKGKTFEEACENLAEHDRSFSKRFCEKSMSYMGRNLYDNIQEASGEKEAM